MENIAKKGVWPVMVTPFKDSGDIDFTALEMLIQWYEKSGVSGLFAVCQSSEMFYLSLDERVELARFVKKHAHIPVIASGHISYSLKQQAEELNRIADTGVDAVIFITNRLAEENGAQAQLKRSVEFLLEALPDSLPLGLYECPYPYKKLVTDEEINFCADTKRFYFLKDTCCDETIIEKRVKFLQNKTLRLFNANTTTLLSSLEIGGEGYSGVMANFHPDLYVWLCKNHQTYKREAKLVSAGLSMCAQIESKLYPAIAKLHLNLDGMPIGVHTRSQNYHLLNDLHKMELAHLRELTDWMRNIVSKLN